MGELKETRNHFLLCWVTKLAVSVLHVSRLCHVRFQREGVLASCVFAVTKERVIMEQERECRVVVQ